MSRTRSRPTPGELWLTRDDWTGPTPYGKVDVVTTQEYIKESKVPGGNNVVHYSVTPYTGVDWSWSPPDGRGIQSHHAKSVCYFNPDNLPALYPPPLTNPLERNNQFELIPAIADLDGTIEMFSKTFLKNMNFGAVTWSMLPFISDVQSLYSTVKELVKGPLDKENKPTDSSRITRVVSPSGAWNMAEHGLEGEWEAKIRMNGHVVWSVPDYSGIEYGLRRMLNELGVHPDLRTVWDIVPLSFVLDYFLPIGDFLESMKPRGWVDYAPLFDGWLSYEVSGKCSQYLKSVENLPDFKVVGKGDFRYYKRVRCLYTMQPEGPSGVVPVEAPSELEKFKAAYLGGFNKAETRFLTKTKTKLYQVARSQGYVPRPRLKKR